jgi:hypothetical protein
MADQGLVPAGLGRQDSGESSEFPGKAAGVVAHLCGRDRVPAVAQASGEHGAAPVPALVLDRGVSRHGQTLSGGHDSRVPDHVAGEPGTAFRHAVAGRGQFAGLGSEDDNRWQEMAERPLVAGQPREVGRWAAECIEQARPIPDPERGLEWIGDERRAERRPPWPPSRDTPTNTDRPARPRPAAPRSVGGRVPRCGRPRCGRPREMSSS